MHATCLVCPRGRLLRNKRYSDQYIPVAAPPWFIPKRHAIYVLYINKLRSHRALKDKLLKFVFSVAELLAG
jgi:hypothetical protein